MIIQLAAFAHKTRNRILTNLLRMRSRRIGLDLGSTLRSDSATLLRRLDLDAGVLQRFDQRGKLLGRHLLRAIALLLQLGG